MREWRQFADLDLAPRSAREYSYWVIRFWSDTLVDLLTATPPRRAGLPQRDPQPWAADVMAGAGNFQGGLEVGTQRGRSNRSHPCWEMIEGRPTGRPSIDLA
jgi:hypothetical protein